MHFLSRDKNFYKQFFSMLFFIAGQNLIVFSVNLADNVMLGNFSESALAGVALANQVQFLLQMVVNGVGEGVVVIASQYWGKRETAPIRHVTGVGMRVALVTGLIFLMAGLLMPEFILGLLSTDQAIVAEGVKYMRIISFSYLLFCMSSVLLATMRHGVYAMALSLLFTSVVSQIINAWPNRKLLDYSYWQQLRDMLPALLLSAAMGAVVYPMNLLPVGDVLMLGAQVLVGVALYVAGSAIFRIDSFAYLLGIVRRFAGKGKGEQE